MNIQDDLEFEKWARGKVSTLRLVFIEDGTIDNELLYSLVSLSYQKGYDEGMQKTIEIRNK